MTSLIVEDIGRTSTIPLIKHLASGPHLSVLCLSRSVSQEFYQTPLQNLDHCFDSLRHLQVYQPIKQTEVENFLDFLASCPFLSHLKIIPQVAWVPSGSLSTSVPHLSSFDGLYSLAISFVAGRPLTSLSLRWMRGENLSKESLSKLAEGSVPLRRLSMVNVTWYNDALLDIAEYFPALQSLKLYAISKYSINWMRERLASDIQSLPELHELVISSVPTMGSQVGDLVLDHMTLKALRSANDRSVLLRL
ncbi:hypothetical protein FRB94_011078 [Tulasnella sp. JGI-2019a]|nr:hypothetical protein FRB94_011078 [Tulasnella sp. JGI-2019a]